MEKSRIPHCEIDATIIPRAEYGRADLHPFQITKYKLLLHAL